MIDRLLLAAFLDHVLIGRRVSITDASLKLEPYAAERSRVFLRNLTTILDACRKNGIYFIAANQQASSGSPGPHDKQARLKLRGVAYGEEARQIRDRWERKEGVTSFEYSFLIHEKLMESLKQWAKAQGVPFVDVIGALDQDRHLLLSWVHLHPDANRVIAARFSEVLLQKFCAGTAQAAQ